MTLRSRVSTLIAVRVVVGTILLGSATLLQVKQPGVFPVDSFFTLIGLTYALSVVYMGTLPFVERHHWLVDAQLGLDAVLVSAFIHVTGGITSYFSSLYLMPIIAASSMRLRRGGLQVATLSAVLYLALVAVQYVDVDVAWPQAWQPQVPVLPTVGFAQYTVAINLGGFFAGALLSGSLAEGLRSAGARLEDASLAMRDLRAFNQLVLDGLHSGLVTTDIDCHVITVNRATGVITGRARHEAVGRDICPFLQLPADFRANLASLGQGRSARVDVEYQTGDARRIDLGVAATTLALPDGRTGYLFTFQDITGDKRLEREARLRQRLAAVGEMAAGIAHEIRNPLASMSGSIQLLRGELPLNEEQTELMDIVLRESDRLNETIRSFLAYARPQRSAIARLDISRIVQDTALLLRHGADVRVGHIVDVDVQAEPVWFEADEHQVRQIVWNLATNGLRAMANGGRLLLSARLDPTVGRAGEVTLMVEDQGCGIPPGDVDDIFQPFHSTFEKGTGLGLAIVHRIVSDYGGAIDVSSVVGGGTRVRVRLPVAPAMPTMMSLLPAPGARAVAV